MGIIQRQTITSTVYSYLGILVGFVNAIILAPRILTPTEIGLTSILIAYSLPFASVASLGFTNVTNRLFPYFRNTREKHNGFLFVSLLVSAGGFVISIAAYFILRSFLIRDSIDQSPLFVEYMNYLIPLIFFTLLFNILDAYNRALFDAVLGTFLKEFLFKIIYCLVLISFMFKWITFPQFVLAFIATNCLPGVIMAGVLIYRGQFSLAYRPDFLSRRMIRLMANISIFGIMSGLSGMAISTIDRFMINSLINLEATGIYTVSFYFSILLLAPMRSLRNISIPIIAELLKAKKYEKIQVLYYKSTLNQLVFGLLIFIGIWGNVNNIFAILPPEYELGKYVILFMMIAKLLEMSTGVATVIIGNSRYYRVQTYLMIFLIIIGIISNLIFIPLWGITGSAVASVISAFLYNLGRVLFIYKKYQIHPFDYKYFILFLITIISYFAGYFIPRLELVIIDILIRSFVIALTYGILILVFRISDEANSMYKQGFSFLKLFFRR